jgi:menaquinone-dependent protoporphyrinogen IX oxidase
MRALIAYDTKYGTTKTIAQWLAEGLGVDCAIKNVSEVEHCDYDLIVIGSPIYTDEPLKSVVTFLDDNCEELKEKNVALFVVYDNLLAQKLEKYEEMLRGHCLAEIVDIGVFGGYFDINQLTEYDRQTIEDFFSRLGKRYDILDSRNKSEVVAFGRRLRQKVEASPV